MEKIVNDKVSDEKLENGYKEYNDIENTADELAKEYSSMLLEKLVKENNAEKFNLSVLLMATSKMLSYLSSYLYDNEEEFLNDVKRARASVVSDVIPALLHPEPCGECEECKNGNFEECINVKTTPEYTTSRFLPLLCNMLIEYDIFNKVLWINTVATEEEDKDNE
jgi:hypothetical protein